MPTAGAHVCRETDHDGFGHKALLYATATAYLDGVVPFVSSGLDAGQAVFIAVPPASFGALQAELRDAADRVTFADMSDVGRNPARIIPAIRGFLDDHGDQRVRIVGEPIWPGRTGAEITEATRHEAMLNEAFADAAVDILCPYDVSGLDRQVVDDAWLTHPRVIDQDNVLTSPRYHTPAELYGPAAAPLDEPPAEATTVVVSSSDLREVRSIVRGFATLAGIPAQRAQDLVLAANEVATNTVAHTDADGTLSMWHSDEGVVCEIRDTGHITDPLVGRRAPDYTSDHGRGLWMANQLCDLVQLRSSEDGTTIRLHVRY